MEQSQNSFEGTMGIIPKAPWTNAMQSKRNPGKFIPQTIAHRGYKARWPENTMAAFQGAVEVGANAIETDVHLSGDGVVVLSHDPSLKRCYGINKKISQCDWEYLETLKTTREPRLGMPRFRDLLDWLNEPGLEDVWVLLDIKINDDAKDLITAVTNTFTQVKGKKPWDQRIVLGCWNATFIHTARQLLPTFPMVHITWHTPYARHFLPIPNLGYNISQPALIGPLRSPFMREAQKEDRQLFVWTVNEERWMEWCLRRNLVSSTTREVHGDEGESVGLLNDEEDKENTRKAVSGRVIDGVITDDPRLFLEVCERWEEELEFGVKGKNQKDGIFKAAGGLKTMLRVVIYQVLSAGYYLHRRWIIGKLDKLTELKIKST